MVSMLDRGDSYRVEYLGSAMLASMGTGLGVLQKPLRELYFGFRQAGKSAKLQERHLSMTSKGMTMTFKERPNSKKVEEVFYGVPNMLSWDAVEFVTVRGPDKKIRGAFEPIDNDISRNKDNLFSIVDKKYHFLQQLRHPPLFCVVLRRTQGVKALDVHAFVCSNDDEALGLVRALNLVQNNYNADESQETGVFAYNPFGKENVRSAAGFDRQGASQSASGSGSRKPHQGTPPGGSLEKQKGVRVLPREGVSRVHSQRQKTGDVYGESNMIRSRSVTNLASAGIFQLTQEDFLQGATKSRTAEDVTVGGGEEERLYADHIERSLERRVTAGDNNRHRPVGEVNNLRSVSKQSPSPFRRSTQSPQFGRGFDSVRDIDIGEPVPPPTRDQKESPREARYTADSKTGQGYGLLSSSQGPLPGYAPRTDGVEGSLRRREADSSYTGSREKSPSYQRTIPRNTSPTQGEKSDQLRKAVPVGGQRSVPVGGQKVFPVGREPPPTPPQNLRPSTLERSPGNLQRSHNNSVRSPSNQDRSPSNPIRRSPSSPAGIRPFASGSRSPSGRDSRASEVKQATGSGNRSPREEEMRSKNSQLPPGRGFKTKDSPGATNRPVAMVTPQKIQGIRVLPMMPTQTQRSNSDNDNKPGTQSSKSKIFDSRVEDNAPAESAANSSSSKKSKAKNTQKLRNELSGNWQFNKVKEEKKQESKASGENAEGEDPSMNEKLLLTKKKDAEIASVMQNLRFDYNDSTISPHGTNFERSLGYFP